MSIRTTTDEQQAADAALARGASDDPGGVPVAVALLVVLSTIPLAAADCGPITIDGGIPQPDPNPEVEITADDIGTLCEYVDGSGDNPTNSCPKVGMTCLITTADLAYTPFAPGINQAITHPFWEDQLTIYRNDGVDEGYCTLVGTWDNPPLCPDGSLLRRFNGNIMACMKICESNNDCRESLVCDFRYLDLEAVSPANDRLGHCVRPCFFDVPDCTRLGWLPIEGDPEFASFFLALEDFLGYSVCNQSTGVCEANDLVGTVPPGGECFQTADCDGAVCLPPRWLDRPDEASGLCMGVCQPNPEDPYATCGDPGFACQEGFQFGHTPFVTKTLTPNLFPGAPLDNQLGGVCLPACQASPAECDAVPGTTCGQPNTDILGVPPQSWNGLEMCLLPTMVAGG